MARVIYTGPLNPVIFARAKKEAEKAGRIKGYNPRVIKTPAHTVVYSKAGSEVKAVVMDMLAPITFSIPGSAIPVAPNFLHLHPDLPEKVYGRPNYATATGYTKNWGIDSDFIGGGYFAQLKDASTAIDGAVLFATRQLTQYEALRTYWTDEDTSHPQEPIQRTVFGTPSDLLSTGSIATIVTNKHSISQTTFAGSMRDVISIVSGTSNADYAYTTSTNYAASYDCTATGAFLESDIRDAAKYGYENILFPHYKNSEINITSIYRQLVSSAFDSKTAGVTTLNIDHAGAVNSASGSVLFTVVESNHNWSFALALTSDSVDGVDSRYSFIKHGVSENLSRDMVSSRVALDYDQTEEISQEERSPIDFFYNQLAQLDKHIFIASSVVSGAFKGVLIWCKIYNKYISAAGTEKAQYEATSAFANSHLAYYFDIFNGVYRLNDAPHYKPPAITTDGICLPHAWFFVRENETRETDFYPNNHNRLSIVIYPQGRHEFSVDEAEIVSVELNHTPRFVARPGHVIAVQMQTVGGGDPLVPYVVNGLVEERDEDDEPTGFYLAADGAVEGVFKPRDGGGDPVATFKLSPRQRLDACRLITVETTTERKYGVQATFEVFGSGVRAQPGPPSITLDCINTSVLAGQKTVFYVTATHLALGSQLRYEVKRAGVVVSAGYLTLANGAGYVEYVAPFTVQSNGGSPQRYVLANPLTGTAAPSAQEFEFSIIHDQAPPPEAFSVRYGQESYANASDRPAALPMPPMFFLQPLVSSGDDEFFTANTQTTLINRLYYSLKSKKVYALFWDGQSCEVSSLLRQNPDTGQYEYNPDWKEVPFDYPPAVDPYGTPGALEPYVYAYLEYEKNRTGA